MNDFTTDLPPEYCQYHDEGCEFAQSCLNCHLPICVYDEPGGKQRLLKRRRAAEMARLFTREGKNIGELAQIFGVSSRTVQRALKVAFRDKTRENGCHFEQTGDSNHQKELDSLSFRRRTQKDIRVEGVKSESGF